MNLVEFLQNLSANNVKLWVDGDKLHYSSPQNVLTPALLTRIKQYKAEIILLLQKRTNTAKTYLLSPIARNGKLPLSPAQERLWLLNQLASNSAFYNIPAAVRLNGQLNIAALEDSFNEIIRRHEALRTNFIAQDGQPIQIIHSNQNLTLLVVNLLHLPTSQKLIETRRLETEEAQRPFDLAKEPLMRATLLKLEETEYILLLTVHHIVSDAWSMGILVRELAAVYEAFCNDLPSPLPELSIQYADFAVWQRRWLQGEVLKTQLHYWQQQLAGAPPLLDLPTDRPRPPVQTFRGGSEQLQLNQELTQKLKILCQQSGSTLFMTLLAAFVTLLYRYGGQEDIVIGSPITNRNRSEIEPLIGFFVNILVLRFDLQGNPSFEELLQRVRQVALDAYAHQDVPFEQVVEALQPERSLSHNPLFQVMFQLRKAPTLALELPGLTLGALKVARQTTQCDLSLDIIELPKGLQASVEYNTDLFDSATLTRMLLHFKTILEDIVTHPEACLRNLPLLTKAEQQQLLVWNNTQPDYIQVPVHYLFEAQVQRTPDVLAIIWEDQQLTYFELNQRANQLAHHLQTLGVGPDVLVGIYIERSLDMVIGLLAILKAGGACLPLDPTYPQNRLAFILSDTQAPILLTQQKLLASLPEHTATVLCLDLDFKTFADCSQSNPISNVALENLAYVIYTSGSTGKPKGVLTPHQAMVNHNLSVAKEFGLQRGHRVLQFASISFDVAFEELFPSLLSGATVVLANDLLAPGTDFLQLLKKHQITVLNLPASYWHEWVRQLPLLPEKMPETLHLVIVGSEKILPERLAAWQQLASAHIRWLNAYGTTESTVSTTLYEPTSEWQVQETPKQVPIGRPIDNTQIYLLDRNQNPVPIGIPGEIHIGGLSLARGYLNRPELTAEKFIPNFFSQQQGTRLYKTGDLAKWLPDGNIEFLGRTDDQLKLRGFRIEPGEIATTLSQHPAVQESVVIAREAPSSNKRLVAYLVPNVQYSGPAGQSPSKQLEAEQLLQWQMVHDNELFNEIQSEWEPSFNISGWYSSYTNQSIPAAEMAEWVESTVQAILSFKPNRVLEIGCGTGLLLFRIAPHCTQYWGSDFSPAALGYVEKILQTSKHQLHQVRLFEKSADDFEWVPAQNKFDAIVLNSVIQYFPNIDYLLRVLEGAVNKVASGGVIFLGDVRNLLLLEAFHTSLQLFQAEASLPIDQLRSRVQKRISQEQELVIDPAFFAALQQQFPQITHVQIQPRRGRYHNELTKFRYNVILHVGREVDASSAITWLDWQQQELTLTSISRLLESTKPQYLGLRCVPNARILTEVKTLALLRDQQSLQTVEEIRSLLPVNSPKTGVEPQDLWALSGKLPYSVEVSWAGAYRDGSFDVLLQLRNQVSKATDTLVAFPKASHRKRLWNTYANNPLQEKLIQYLVPQLRDYLQSQLPEYMLPSAFVLLESLPLTPNGKLNRQALPNPDAVRYEKQEAFIAPRTPLEKQLANIFAEILDIKQVDIYDNFFDLGGHSQLAIQLITQLSESFQVKLPLCSLFEAPTVSGLAESIEVAQRSSSSVSTHVSL